MNGDVCIRGHRYTPENTFRKTNGSRSCRTCRRMYINAKRAGISISPAREDRFWHKVAKSAGCWLWKGGVSAGYGRFADGRRNIVCAHRYAYELAVGPIPEGFQIDHLCRNRLCVRPDHLEAVTQQENIRRQFAETH